MIYRLSYRLRYIDIDDIDMDVSYLNIDVTYLSINMLLEIVTTRCHFDIIFRCLHLQIA